MGEYWSTDNYSVSYMDMEEDDAYGVLMSKHEYVAQLLAAEIDARLSSAVAPAPVEPPSFSAVAPAPVEPPSFFRGVKRIGAH